jgi:hypothetical protein
VRNVGYFEYLDEMPPIDFIVELTQQDWRHHYGVRWQELAEAKRRYDPDAVFASGPQLYFT